MELSKKQPEVIGYDLGGTIFQRIEGTMVISEEALYVIRSLTHTRFASRSYIVSRADEEQKIRATNILKKERFFEATEIPKEHLIFCSERHEKAPICTEHGITHFIDDRPEVLAHLTDVPHRILFGEVDWTEYERFRERLKGVTFASCWTEVDRLLFPYPAYRTI
jgi:hypothetical protein